VLKSEHCHNELVASFDSGPLKCLRAMVDRPSYVLAGAVLSARTPHAKRSFLHRSLSDAPKGFPADLDRASGAAFSMRPNSDRCDALWTVVKSWRRRAFRLPQPELQRAETMGELFLISFGKDSAVSCRAESCASAFNKIHGAYRRGIGANYQLAYPTMDLHEFEIVIYRSTDLQNSA
jgi:hypothetical protein